MVGYLNEPNIVSLFNSGMAAKEIMREAQDRYDNDIEFHAKVFRAVEVFNLVVKINNGVDMLEEFREASIVAISIHLILEEKGM